MYTLDVHVPRRLGSERDVCVTGFRDCRGTLAPLVRQGLVERGSIDLGDDLRITPKGGRETVTVPDSFPPDLTG